MFFFLPARHLTPEPSPTDSDPTSRDSGAAVEPPPTPSASARPPLSCSTDPQATSSLTRARPKLASTSPPARFAQIRLLDSDRVALGSIWSPRLLCSHGARASAAPESTPPGSRVDYLGSGRRASFARTELELTPPLSLLCPDPRRTALDLVDPRCPGLWPSSATSGSTPPTAAAASSLCRRLSSRRP